MVARKRHLVDDKKKTSVSTLMFRIVLSVVGVLTVLNVSHGIRYALVGVLFAIALSEWLYARYQHKAQ